MNELEQALEREAKDECPAIPPFVTMGVYADWLEDQGTNPSLVAAYRWAISNKTWPKYFASIQDTFSPPHWY